MIPKLYDNKENYIGELSDCIRGVVIEERNGMFEAELEYQLFSQNWDKLVRGNIIVTHANDTLLNQKFRIYKIGKTIRGKFTVFAKHISYDMQRDMIEGLDISNQSCEYCLNMIFRNSQFSQKFKGYSNIINAQNFKIGPTKLLTAIGGTEGSIIDTFGTGAELLRDNENIHILNKRGNDNGVIIEYAENLTGLDITEDEDGLITRIRAKAKYTPEGGEETEIFTYVDSSHIFEYETPFIGEIDFSDKFEDGEIPTVEKLTKLGEAYFRDNKCDIFEGNYKIQFIPLSKCAGYEDIEDKISLCDTVTIKDYRYNLDTKAKVIKATYDFLRERYESMEVGQPRTTLGDVVGGSDSNKGEQGPPGPQGPPGKDGDMENFPDTLPSKPVLNSKLYGFASIELSWTYENKVYYNYELYASKTKDFTPNAFDIIHSGQTSSFLFQAKPNETWYFRVCAVNSHGNRSEFSSQIAVTTKKIDDMSNYFEDAAIGRAVVGSLTADYMEGGIIKGNWVDAKNLSVTDGNGKRTLDIDSFGNVSMDVSELSIKSVGVPTYNQVIAPGKAIADINITPGKVRISANKIDLQGAVSAGGVDEGNYVYIAQENYNVYKDNINTMTVGTINKDEGIVPAVFMGANGHSGGANYGALFHMGNRQVLSHYNSNRNDWSEISLYSNGTIDIAPAGGLILNSGAGIGINAHMFPHNQETIYLGNVGNPFSDMATKALTLAFNGAHHGSVYGRDGRVSIEAGEGHDIYLSTAYDAVKIDKDNGHLMPTKYNRQRLGNYDADSRWTTICLLSNPDVSSDVTLKENINYIQTGDIQTLSIDYNDDTSENITLNDMYAFFRDEYKLASYNYIDNNRETIGFIAQDIQNTKVGKKLIHSNVDGKLSFDSGVRQSVVEGALMKAIEKIEMLERKIDSLLNK